MKMYAKVYKIFLLPNLLRFKRGYNQFLQVSSHSHYIRIGSPGILKHGESK